MWCHNCHDGCRCLSMRITASACTSSKAVPLVALLRFCPPPSPLVAADSRMLLTACDDCHAHLYDVGQAALVEAFSGEGGGGGGGLCKHE
jgi:hypothetical protein